MKRAAYQSLLSWKNSTLRKPLLVTGARQTGKTWLLKEFGRSEYQQIIYCNFEEDANYHRFFETSLEPRGVVSRISTYKNVPIRPGQDLIVLDEIQTSNGALNSLKYFCEEAPEYHIIAAGSLLGVKLSQPKSFPVGKVTFLDVYPMTFLEFLDAVGESRYRDMLENLQTIEPLAQPFHDRLVELLRAYYIVGGMPEAVSAYSSGRELDEVRTIQAAIVRTYVQDFVKHAPAPDIPKLTRIWESIPAHLARENKKFIFSALASGARARQYGDALTWLSDAGLIYRCFAVEHIEQPIAGFADRDAFKVYALDVGILGAMAGLAPQTLAMGDELFITCHGAFVENYVAQQLRAHSTGIAPTLHYWKSRSGQAEVDFLLDRPPRVFPLEVKAGINPRSKSMATYDQQFHPAILVRTTLLNLRKDGRVLNVPLYAVELLDRFIQLALGTTESAAPPRAH